MESNFRDVKQSIGLNHFQARDLDKFYSHFNTSLTTVNITKIIHLNHINKGDKPFSIADCKLQNTVSQRISIKPVYSGFRHQTKNPKKSSPYQKITIFRN